MLQFLLLLISVELITKNVRIADTQQIRNETGALVQVLTRDQRLSLELWWRPPMQLLWRCRCGILSPDRVDVHFT
jgi:hypothetical protein